MTLPTPVKTYTYDHTTQTGGDGTACCRAVLYRIKEQMKAIGGWTVKGSSNSTAAGMDNTDRWTSSSSSVLVWANPGAIHSWIVLESTALGIQILLDLQADGSNRTLWPSISPGKLFTGGSTTTAPTATDQIQVYDGSGTLFSEGAVATSVDLHIMASTDNEVFRAVILTTSGALGPSGGWMLEKIQGAPAGLTCPVFITIAGTNQNFNGATYPWQRALITDGDASLLRGASPLQPGVSQHLLLGGEGRQQGATSYIVNTEYDGQSEAASAPGWLLLPMSVWGYSPGNYGRLGYLADIWHAPQTPATCDSFPSGGTRTHMIFGDVVLPWDGTVMSSAYTRTARDGYAPPAGAMVDRTTLLFTPNAGTPITFSQLGPPGGGPILLNQVF